MTKVHLLVLRRFLSGLFFVASILICCFFLFPVVACTQNIQAEKLFRKPLQEVEPILGKAEYGAGSGPINDRRVGYHFAVKGFSRVSVGYSEKRGMTRLSFVFPPGMVVNERVALAVVGVRKRPQNCGVSWSVDKFSGESRLSFDL